jgi:NitT/TauT family transport system substrate-binding protein
MALLALARPRWAAASSLQQIRINIPGPGSLPFLPIDLIPKLGLDRELGVQLGIRYFPSGIQAMESMLADNAEFSGFAFSVVPKMQAKGSDLVAIAPISGETPRYAVVVREDLRGKIRSLSDLAGRSVGVSLGSAQSKTYLQTVAEQLLAGSGVSPSQVRWVGTSQSIDGQVGALAAGKVKVVDAVFCEEPFISALVKRKLGFVIADLRDPGMAARIPGLNHLRAAISTTRALAAQDPARVEKMVSMLKLSLAWMSRHNPEEIVSTLGITDAVEREERIAVLKHAPGMFSDNVRFSRQQLLATKDFLLATTNLLPDQINIYKSMDSRWAGMKP